jgi:hypothetical protein
MEVWVVVLLLVLEHGWSPLVMELPIIAIHPNPIQSNPIQSHS